MNNEMENTKELMLKYEQKIEDLSKLILENMDTYGILTDAYRQLQASLAIHEALSKVLQANKERE